jgi:hypothetical protein
MENKEIVVEEESIKTIPEEKEKLREEFIENVLKKNESINKFPEGKKKCKSIEEANEYLSELISDDELFKTGKELLEDIEREPLRPWT